MPPHPLRQLVDARRKVCLSVQVAGYDVTGGLKSCCLDHLYIVRWVVRYTKRGPVFKPFDQQPQPVEGENSLNEQRPGEKRAHKCAGEARNDNQHGVSKDVAVKDSSFCQPLGTSGYHILFVNLI